MSIEPLVYLAGAIMLLGAVFVVFQLICTADDGVVGSILDGVKLVAPNGDVDAPVRDSLRRMYSTYLEDTAEVESSIRNVRVMILIAGSLVLVMSVCIWPASKLTVESWEEYANWLSLLIYILIAGIFPWVFNISRQQHKLVSEFRQKAASFTQVVHSDPEETSLGP